MRKSTRFFAGALSLAMIASLALTGCTGGNEKETTAASETTASAGTTVADETKPADAEGNFIELGLHVLYNDSDKACYNDEVGASIIVTEEGQYTLTFDCATDLSDATTGAGISTLTNLTAIYIKDEGIAKNEQSPLKAANIKYDSVKVDDTELTITKTEAKSAFKTSGFDTNDPINAWDGSAVEEVDIDSANHVANFNSVENPTKISVTFTLSDFDWDGSGSGEGGNSASSNDYVNTAKFSDIDFTDVSAVELTKYLGNGINLGNTFEATSTSGKDASVTTYETAWGQPETTEAMIQGMKNCGFDTIRIPVAWCNTMDYLNGDFEINEDYIERVAEVVQWAVDAEMFVIINDHWDSGWWSMFGSSKQEDVDLAWKVYESIWTQVAERFKDFSDLVIFESANEELGNSLNDNSQWADSGSLTDAGKYEMTNAINQKFVDIIRNSGGNNDDRFLLIAGYNTNIALTLDSQFVMPTDTAKDKLFVSVHYYDPWNYCGAGDGSASEANGRWGLKSEYEYMQETLSSMKAFVDKGYGVIIGEYAVIPIYNDGNQIMQPNTLEYTSFLLDICDVNNLCPVLWSKDDFFDKTTLNMIDETILTLFTSRCYAEESAAGDNYLTTVQSWIEDALANAVEMWDDVETIEEGTPMAYIMWNGGAGSYNVGDAYTPQDCTAGITPTNVEVTGPGTYTVSLDFAGGNDGLTFAALALNAGEDLYPGCILDIKEITYDGNVITQIADDYTSSDDKHCTRVNLINEWVNKLPDDARTVDGNLDNASPVILDKTLIVGIKNISITFELVVPE